MIPLDPPALRRRATLTLALMLSLALAGPAAASPETFKRPVSAAVTAAAVTPNVGLATIAFPPETAVAGTVAVIVSVAVMS